MITQLQHAPRSVASQRTRHVGGRRCCGVVAIWGLAFKPNTDDIREAPSLTTIDFLLDAGATIHGHDPEAASNISEYYGDRVQLFEDAYACAKGADVLILLTEWRQYQSPDFKRLNELMNQPVIFDGRNIWSSYDLSDQGFTYTGIGTH